MLKPERGRKQWEKLEFRDEHKAKPSSKTLSSAKKMLKATINLDRSCKDDDVEYEELRNLGAELKTTEENLKMQRI